MSHFNQSNKQRKTCVLTTKYERLSDMCIVHNVGMKSVFTFQPMKRLVSTTVKSAKLAAAFRNFPFKAQKPTIMLFGVDGTHFLPETRVATSKKNYLHFLGSFSGNHNQAHPNLNQKKVKMSPNLE